MSAAVMRTGRFDELLALAAGMLDTIQHDDLGRPELVKQMRDLQASIQQARDNAATTVATVKQFRELDRLTAKLLSFAATAKETARARLASLPPAGPLH